MIPRLKPTFQYDEIKALFCREKADTHVKAFEAEFAQWHGAPYAVFFPYARMALFALLCALRLKSRIILMPAYTCVVMADAVILAGYEPKFIDIDDDGLVPAHTIISAEHAEAGALILTDLFGHILPYKDKMRVLDWAKKNDVLVINDKAMNLTPIDTTMRPTAMSCLFSASC